MRNFFNLVIIFAILALGHHFWPQYIMFDGGWETIALTALFLLLADLVFLVVGIIVMIPLSFFDVTETIGTILLVILAFLWTPIKLYIVSSLYAPFTIAGGFWVYALLTLVLGFFTMSGKSSKE